MISHICFAFCICFVLLCECLLSLVFLSLFCFAVVTGFLTGINNVTIAKPSRNHRGVMVRIYLNLIKNTKTFIKPMYSLTFLTVT